MLTQERFADDLWKLIELIYKEILYYVGCTVVGRAATSGMKKMVSTLLIAIDDFDLLGMSLSISIFIVS